MATPTLKNIRLVGMTTRVPKRITSNLTDCKPQSRAERECLMRNTGIETRRMVQEWQRFPDLAFDAVGRLLESLEWKCKEVDVLTVMTQFLGCLALTTVIILQDRLRLPHSTVAFDVNLGCSAYPFVLNLLGSLIATGGAKEGLVLVGDRGASVNDPIFSGAGTAIALELYEGAPSIHLDLNNNGSGYKTIILPVGGHRKPVGVQHLLPFCEDGNDHWHHAINLQLDGTTVLSFSAQRVSPIAEKLLDYAGTSKDEVGYLIFHQVNRMINETIRKKLGLPIEKVPSTLCDFGNTSGASLSVTMAARISREFEAGRNRVLLCDFNIGLSQGTCLVGIEGTKFPNLIESWEP